MFFNDEEVNHVIDEYDHMFRDPLDDVISLYMQKVFPLYMTIEYEVCNKNTDKVLDATDDIVDIDDVSIYFYYKLLDDDAFERFIHLFDNEEIAADAYEYIIKTVKQGAGIDLNMIFKSIDREIEGYQVISQKILNEIAEKLSFLMIKEAINNSEIIRKILKGIYFEISLLMNERFVMNHSDMISKLTEWDHKPVIIYNTDIITTYVLPMGI